MRHGSSSSSHHAHAEGQSAGAAAYEAQTPRLFGEAVRACLTPLPSTCATPRAQAALYSLDPLSHAPLLPPPSPHPLIPAPPLQPVHGERTREAWEIPFFLTIGGVAAVFFAYQFRPSTNPHDWARDEAEERFRR